MPVLARGTVWDCSDPMDCQPVQRSSRSTQIRGGGDSLTATQGRRGARLARPRHRSTGGRRRSGSALRLRAPH
eukprot:1003141-Pleurochrysis_carterae.AAC.1